MIDPEKHRPGEHLTRMESTPSVRADVSKKEESNVIECTSNLASELWQKPAGQPGVNELIWSRNAANKPLELFTQLSSGKVLEPLVLHDSKPGNNNSDNVTTTDSKSDRKSYLQTIIDAGTNKVISDDATRETVNKALSSFVKIMSLFSKGNEGMAASFLVYGLANAHPQDSWKEQAADFVLGGAKGPVMKQVFSTVGPVEVIAPIKGAVFGLILGTADEILQRETFTNPGSLKERLLKSTLNRQAVAMNAAVSTGAEGVYVAVDYLSGGALSSNRLISSMVMSGAFGFVGGTLDEATRELNDQKFLVPSQVLKKGAMSGSISAISAGLSSKIWDTAFQQKIRDSIASALSSSDFQPHLDRVNFSFKNPPGNLENLESAKKDAKVVYTGTIGEFSQL
jgi:hypothetical protein